MTRTRAALAGAAAALTWAALEPLDRRAFRSDYSDVAVLGKAVTARAHWRLAGLALQNEDGSLIICNGYKDPAFIRMALMGRKLGKTVIMVVEKLEELKQIIAVSRQFGVEPDLGIRCRLLSKGAGKWA